MHTTPIALCRPYYAHQPYPYPYIPPTATSGPAFAASAATLESAAAAAHPIPPQASVNMMYPHPHSHYFHRVRGGGRGPSRIVWFIIGASAASWYYHKHSRADHNVIDDPTSHHRTFAPWRFRSDPAPAASPNMVSSSNERRDYMKFDREKEREGFFDPATRMAGRESEPEQGREKVPKAQQSEIKKQLDFEASKAAVERQFGEKKEDAALFVAKRIDDLTNMLERLKQSLEASLPANADEGSPKRS